MDDLVLALTFVLAVALTIAALYWRLPHDGDSQPPPTAFVKTIDPSQDVSISA